MIHGKLRQHLFIIEILKVDSCWGDIISRNSMMGAGETAPSHEPGKHIIVDVFLSRDDKSHCAM